MLFSTKCIISTVIILLIVGILVLLYFKIPMPQHKIIKTMTNIKFQRPPKAHCRKKCIWPEVCHGDTCVNVNTLLPVFTFTFSEPIDHLDGKIVILKNFTIDPKSNSKDAELLIKAMLNGGGIIFTPVITSPTTMTTNTLPAAKLVSKVTQPLNIDGSGEIWVVDDQN
jgi:hypothetical protein